MNVEQQQAPQEAAPEGQGGGVAEALTKMDESLSKLVAAVGQSPAPEAAKAAFQAAQQAFRQGLEALTSGGEPEQGGPVSMEAGASGARPMSPGGPR